MTTKSDRMAEEMETGRNGWNPGGAGPRRCEATRPTKGFGILRCDSTHGFHPVRSLASRQWRGTRMHFTEAEPGLLIEWVADA